MGSASGFDSLQTQECRQGDKNASFTLLVRGAAKPFQVNQNTLGACSEYFRAVMKYNEKEGFAYVDDVDPEAFAKLLLLNGGKEVDLVSVTDTLATLHTGVKCLYPDLVQLCCDYLKTHLSPDNVLRVLHEVHPYCLDSEDDQPSAPPVPLLAPCAEVKQQCWAMVDVHANDILVNSYVTELPHDLLLALVLRDTLVVKSEKVIFKAVFQWAKKECNRCDLDPTSTNCRLVLGDILFAIRFLNMTWKHWTGGPASSRMLTDDEVRFLEARLKKESPGEVPSTFAVRVERLKKPRNYEGTSGDGNRPRDRILMGFAHFVDVVFG